MRFPELDFTQYAGVTVTSATVSLRDLMCEETEMTVYCYPFTGTAWTESTASWSALTTQSWGEELDSQAISYNNGLTQDSSHRYEFDISDAVQAWIDGTADSAKGIIFKAHEDVETATTQLSKIFGSFEQDGYKPIFEMTYSPQIDLDYAVIDVDEGLTFDLTATTTPLGETIFWSSSNPSVATVENGTITGLTTGVTTITATCEGVIIPASCIVYVTISDGVYYIQQPITEHVLQTDGSFTERYTSQEVDVFLNKSHPNTTNEHTKASELWKIKHIQAGYYSIRPLNDLNSQLIYKTSGEAVAKNMDYDDSPGEIPVRGSWQIMHTNGVYTINTYQYDETFPFWYLQADSTESTPITVTTGIEPEITFDHHWKLIPVNEYMAGIILYNYSTRVPLTFSPSLTISVGSSYDLTTDFQIQPIAYASDSIDQNIQWVSSNPNIVIVDQGSGKVTAIAPGYTSIVGTTASGGRTEINLNVEIASGIYFIENKFSGKYASIPNDSTVVLQYEFQWSSNQEWYFEKCTDGYYTIKAVGIDDDYYLGVNSDSTNSGASIVLRTDLSSDSTKWRITTTDNGSCTLSPKSDSTGTLVLALYGENDLNNAPLAQLTYTDNDLYNDEWMIRKMKPLELSVYYDSAYKEIYGGDQGAQTQIEADLLTARELYWEAFGIYITYETPSWYNLYCCHCEYCVDGKCYDEINCRDHHTNYQNIINNVPTTASSPKVFYLGHELCSYTNETHDVSFGKTMEFEGWVLISAYQNICPSGFTLCHELGHLFYAEDHYGGNSPSTNTMNQNRGEHAIYERNCIYGEAYKDYDVYTFCPGCYQTISENADKFSLEA